MDRSINEKQLKILRIISNRLFPKGKTFSFGEKENKILEKFLELSNVSYELKVLLLSTLIDFLKKLKIPFNCYETIEENKKIYMLREYPERVLIS